MTIERGLVIGGQVIPGTDRVIRDSRYWWEPGRETRDRDDATIDMLVGHWTAGPARIGPRAGRALFEAMEARKTKAGGDLSVSVNLGVAWDAGIWQFADLLTGCVHVGARPIIKRSVSLECMWPGSMKLARELKMKDAVEVLRIIDGRRVRCVQPSDQLLEAWRWICETLTSPAASDLGLAIPRRTLGLRRTLPWLARCGGGIAEHATLPRAADPRQVKIDACGLLLDALDYPAAA